MAEMIPVRSRQEYVEQVRAAAAPSMYDGAWFDAAPDFYRGTYDPGTVRIEEAPTGLPLGSCVMEMTVEPPIDPLDEAALVRAVDPWNSNSPIRDIMTSHIRPRSILTLVAPTSQPPQATANSILARLNHVHDYRTQTGVYDPQMLPAHAPKA